MDDVAGGAGDEATSLPVATQPRGETDSSQCPPLWVSERPMSRPTDHSPETLRKPTHSVLTTVTSGTA